MTLILNEIHILDGLEKTMLVAAADRRIFKPDGTYDSTRRKLFPIPSLKGAISYFGLAYVYPKGKAQYLSDWLPSFIRSEAAAANIETFCRDLRTALHRVMRKDILKDNPSGFHICGYREDGLPEFWSLMNMGGLDGFRHVNFRSEYNDPSPDFLERDASGQFGWDGISPSSAKKGILTYRNGDFRGHVAAWDALDDTFSKLIQFPDFKRPSTSKDYGDYVKFKFEIIAYFYKRWARNQIIARPIDVIVLSCLSR
jgi:hypothetical protein